MAQAVYDKDAYTVNVFLYEGTEKVARCSIDTGGMLCGFEVKPEWRGKGLSHELMQAAINNPHIPPTRLWVGPFNRSPLDKEQTAKLYEKHGWTRYCEGNVIYMKRSVN